MGAHLYCRNRVSEVNTVLVVLVRLLSWESFSWKLLRKQPPEHYHEPVITHTKKTLFTIALDCAMVNNVFRF